MSENAAARTHYGSRWKAGVFFLVCLAFVGVGWWLVRLGTIRTEVIGWLSIGVFGAFALLWLIAIIVPNKLTIHPDGFSVKQWFLPDKPYKFDDIAALGVSRRQRIPMVVWTYKNRSEVLGSVKAALGQPNDYDAYLPVGWQVSSERIAQQITLARQLYVSRTPH